MLGVSLCPELPPTIVAPSGYIYPASLPDETRPLSALAHVHARGQKMGGRTEKLSVLPPADGV